MTYYGAFCRSELYPLLRRINSYLMRWLMNKCKRYRTWKKAIRARTEAAETWPRYFAHWAWLKPARQMTRTTRAV
jgi:RNA-directed DNA polymerase